MLCLNLGLTHMLSKYHLLRLLGACWIRWIVHCLPSNHHLPCQLRWAVRRSLLLIFLDHSPLVCCSSIASVFMTCWLRPSLLLSWWWPSELKSPFFIHFFLQLSELWFEFDYFFISDWGGLNWDSVRHLVFCKRILPFQVVDWSMELYHLVLLDLKSWPFIKFTVFRW